MKIENIKKLQNGKYKITLDNGEKMNLHDEVILNNNLLFNNEIDEEKINDLNNENENYDHYNKVVNFISYKMRSKKEIIEYMKKREYSDKEIDEIVERLTNNRLINDESYVRAFILDKINLSLDGPNKIKNELLNHDININIIEEELSKYDENIFYDKLEKILLKKSKSNHKYSKYIFKQKLIDYCINLGYLKSMIIEIVENIDIDSNDAVEKEFNKLSKKYSNNIYEIKNRLLKKGFTMNEINNCIEKSEY